MAQWYKLTDTVEEIEKLIPQGKGLQLQVGEERVCLIKAKGGLRALGNNCPHLGAPLHRGTVNHLDEIICPWHSYCYNTETGTELENRSASATIYPIEVREDGVYVLGN